MLHREATTGWEWESWASLCCLSSAPYGALSRSRIGLFPVLFSPSHPSRRFPVLTETSVFPNGTTKTTRSHQLAGFLLSVSITTRHHRRSAWRRLDLVALWPFGLFCCLSFAFCLLGYSVCLLFTYCKSSCRLACFPSSLVSRGFRPVPLRLRLRIYFFLVVLVSSASSPAR